VPRQLMKPRRPSVILVALLMSACFSSGQTQLEPGTGIEGVITITPIRPGPVREGVSSSAPLANTAFAVENEKAAVASFTTDDQGRFHVSLTPGHYVVSLKEKKGRIGRFGPVDVDVAPDKMTKVEWRCDSGMR
jgi:hypothetical protein